MATFDYARVFERDFAANPDVRCDKCSPFVGGDGPDAGLPLEVDGRVRAWAPRWSMKRTPCVDCGGPVDPEPVTGWEEEE